MRRRRSLLGAVATLALLAAAAPSAAAQSFLDAFDGATIGTYATGPASGAVTVDFQGDEAAGCAAAGVCDVHGTVTWQPAGVGELFTIGSRRNGRQYETGFLGFAESDDEVDVRPASITAHVRRGDGLCIDGSGPTFTTVALGPERGRSLTVRLASARPRSYDSDSLRTRCAGPSLADIASVLPASRLSRRALRRGRNTLDFSADAPFAAGGFAGRVRSNVVVKLGRAEVSHDLSEEGSGEIVARRRAISVRYRVERVSGAIRSDFAGLDDPDLCGPLDACGLTGSVTSTLDVRDAEAYISGSIDAGRGARSELRRALGLAPGRMPSLSLDGTVLWNRDLGGATSELARGGVSACRETLPAARDGAIIISARRKRLVARYEVALLGEADPLRTRCPGPGLADVAPSGPLAVGSLPRSALRRPRLTFKLKRASAFRDNGYRGSVRSEITVVLRRVAVREWIQVEREDGTEDVPLKVLARP